MRVFARPDADRKGLYVRAALSLLLATLAIVVMTVSPAYAYDKTGSGRACVDCHGSSPVDGSRKGPHAGYTTGTQKCATCHETHNSSDMSALLLPAATVKATCETCHDGTGGTGVYGVLKARGIIKDGEVAPAAHRIEVTNLVPGGSPTGDIQADFAGKNQTDLTQPGTLTCTDCHSPHDAETVAPFIGDRVRASKDETVVATNRLLKRVPTTGITPVAEYGSSWCSSCHKGRMSHTGGTASNHPVEQESDFPAGQAFVYDRLATVAGVNTTSAAMGRLGGNNLGYVMPDLNGAEPGRARSAVQGTHQPICQQCHEDARHVGDSADASEQGMVLTNDVNGMNESFKVALNGDDTDAPGTYNPRFQSFPHESASPSFLIEQSDDLCTNCHVK